MVVELHVPFCIMLPQIERDIGTADCS